MALDVRAPEPAPGYSPPGGTLPANRLHKLLAEAGLLQSLFRLWQQIGGPLCGLHSQLPRARRRQLLLPLVLLVLLLRLLLLVLLVLLMWVDERLLRLRQCVPLLRPLLHWLPPGCRCWALRAVQMRRPEEVARTASWLGTAWGSARPSKPSAPSLACHRRSLLRLPLAHLLAHVSVRQGGAGAVLREGKNVQRGGGSSRGCCVNSLAL